MKPDSEPTLKPFSGPVRWLGIGFLAMGALVLASAVWSQIETFDPEELLGTGRSVAVRGGRLGTDAAFAQDAR